MKRKESHCLFELLEVAIVLFLCLLDCVSGAWTTLTPTPGGRDGAILGAFYKSPPVSGQVGKRILVLYGGTSNSNVWAGGQSDLWFYDVAAQTWTTQSTPNPPPSLAFPCGCVAGARSAPRLFVFGGLLASGVASSTLYSIDLLNPGSGWETVNTGASPPGRQLCTAISLHEIPDIDTSTSFYVFGGNDSVSYYSDLYRFDLASSNWVALMSYPGGFSAERVMTSAVQIGSDQLWFYGGLTSGGVIASDVFYFNVSAVGWVSTGISKIPNGIPRFGGFLSSNQTTFYLVGGTDNPNIFSDLYSIPFPIIGGDSWTLDSSAYAAYRMAGVTTTIAGIKFAEDTFFVYGGNNGGPVTGFEEYVISQQAHCPSCYNGIPDPLIECQCCCNAGFGGFNCSLGCPICINGRANISGCSCVCFPGWQGSNCDVPVCNAILCNSGACVASPSDCTNGTAQNQPLSSEPVATFQALISSLTGGNISIPAANTSSTIRVTLQVPPVSFKVFNSGGQEQPNATTTQFSISPVSPSYLSTLSVPLTNIISNVVDISLQENVVWQNATATLSFTIDAPPDNACLAFIDTATGKWVCIESGLFMEGNTLIGTTTHFTAFGVILTGSSNGGDGFNLVYIAPIVIGAFALVTLLLLAIGAFILVSWLLARYRIAQGRSAINWAPEGNQNEDL